MFRFFREVEKHLDEAVAPKDKEEGYKQIKPETDMTIEKAKNFLDDLFCL